MKATKKVLRKRGKPVSFDNLHVTLVFLGAVEQERRVCAESVAAQVEVASFTLSFDRLGYWPRPRVVWSSPSDPPQPLAELVSTLNQELRGCGFSPESRPYRAHLTLARKVTSPLPDVAHAPVDWPIDKFHLVQSETHPDGARYRVLKSWPLHSPTEVTSHNESQV